MVRGDSRASEHQQCDHAANTRGESKRTQEDGCEDWAQHREVAATKPVAQQPQRKLQHRRREHPQPTQQPCLREGQAEPVHEHRLDSRKSRREAVHEEVGA